MLQDTHNILSEMISQFHSNINVTIENMIRTNLEKLGVSSDNQGNILEQLEKKGLSVELIHEDKNGKRIDSLDITYNNEKFRLESVIVDCSGENIGYVSGIQYNDELENLMEKLKS